MPSWRLLMPIGLEVYDANKKLIISVTDRITKILGSVYTNGAAGSISVPELSKGKPWANSIVVDGGNAGPLVGALVTISGTTISWSYNDGYNLPPPLAVRKNSKITYGIY